MPAISTIIAGVGLAAGAVGTVTQMKGASAAAKASEKAEKIRADQMKLDADRQRREIARKMTQARSLALSNATQQGAGLGSGLQGGYGQISGEANRGAQSINQNQGMGTAMFGANAQVAAAGTTSATGSGLSSLGGGLVSNSGTIGKLGEYAIGKLT